MRRYVKNLFYSSVMVIASIGISSNIEARVTKEIAEAVLPYLMKTVGIQEDTRPTQDPNPTIPCYIQAKKDAIISMIYTDAGQQQMVDWVQKGMFPLKLSEAGFKSADTYKDKAYRDATLASLFPCGTGTFTSFANHESRLGKHLLSTDNAQKLRILKKIFHKNLDVESVLPNVNYIHIHDIDSIIAKIVFVLEICDDAAAIANLVFTQQDATDFIKDMKKKPSNSEYLCRPISAIVSKNISEKYEGDCTETLYKHLINIAIQDEEHLNKFYTDKIPELLRQYYTPKKQAVELNGTTYAGETSIVRHDKWKEQLSNFLTKRIQACYHVQPVSELNNMITKTIMPTISFSKDNALKLEKFLSIGSVQNIAAVLASVSDLQIKSDDPAVIIGNALNALSSNRKRFKVEHVKKANEKYPWITDQIIISEQVKGKVKRTITVGICDNELDANYGHSEIVSITPVGME